MVNKRFGITIGISLFLLVGCAEGSEIPVQNTEMQQTQEQQLETSETIEGEEVSEAIEVTESVSELQETEVPPDTSYDFTVCFAGDVNLDENWATTQYLNQCENGITDCIDETFIKYMQDADIMCLNNEFTYSDRGTPLEGKAYTFRANPERVEILKELGVDVVKLANNHVYDYGKDALLDTLATLDAAGIAHMGAGENLSEAMEPVYMEVDGKIIAFVAASRAEKNKMTPQATENNPGILRCYDPELFKQVIAEADANADFVLAYVHWGTENSYQLEEAQLTTGKEYLDAGADVVIGAHSHCLQGMEYYEGKPIIYSLGNYWFNGKTMDTMLLQLHFYGEDEQQNLEVKVIPGVQSNCTTKYADTVEEQERIYQLLEEISVNVEISEEGIVYEK
uniref:CapA family protein n=1 Tax=Acetatifactor sp. TaxID=1872090 RepID=UPI004057AA84